jgi:Glycosyltransferase family 9 (heptosyltransferase)
MLPQRRDDGAALLWFDRAVELDSAEARYWSNRGAALQQLGRADALSSYDAAVCLGLAEPALVEARLGRDGFKIGVCWRGSANPEADHGRAVPLAALAPLAGGGGRLISLQKFEGSPPDDLARAPWLELAGDDFDRGPDGFVDTAALMESLDLIVTCDTSVAHLAGALGHPVIVLLQAVADWRWLTDREDCPWYPTMRLIRQSRLGDWSEPVRRLSEEIQKLRSTSV